MGVRNALLGVVVAVAGFLVVGVVVTELASTAIEFSLFVGLPAGVVAGLLSGALAYRWLGAAAAGPRRRGVALAAFGVVFLGALVALVVGGGLRNSQALPVAGLAGVVAAGGAYLRHRRATGTDTSPRVP